MIRGFLASALILLLLAGCSGMQIVIQAQPAATQFPTSTPNIIIVTPVTLLPPITATFPSTPFTATFTPTFTQIPPADASLTFTSTLGPTSTETPFTPTATNTNTGPTPIVSITTVILGCNTSIDILHGMGEVTNAYVTISNTGLTESDNVCATLHALDEGRPHPDKTKCVPALPAKYQVTQKLTVDTTLSKPTPIQMDITNSAGPLQRIAQDSCTNIGIFVPDVGILGVVKPILQP